MVTPKCSAQEIRHGAAGRDKHGRGADGPPPERAARRGDDRSRSRAAAGCCDDREAARRARVAGRSRRLLSSRESGGKRKQAMSCVGEAQVARKLTAMLAADVVGFSRLMGVDEEGTLERLKAHRKTLIDPKIAEHQGRIIKTTGDGLLVEFSSVVDAVRCAVEIQRGIAERNADLPEDRRIDFRIGINLGDVIVDGDDIFGDGRQGDLANGLTEDILTKLARVPDLIVVARGASANDAEAEADADLTTIGRELAARYLLSGSIRRVADGLRVTAQLIEVAGGDHIWAEHYDLPGDEALTAQDELTETISTQLVVRIRHRDLHLARLKPAATLNAYDDYLLGKEQLARDDFAGFAKARELFEKALAADTRYAPAVGGLAMLDFRDFHLHRGDLRSELGGDAALDRVFATAQRSLGLDASESDATDAVANVYLFRHRHEEAAELLRKAIADTADDVDLRERLGVVLIFAGEAAKGVAEIERMMRLNPFYRQAIFGLLARGY